MLKIRTTPFCSLLPKFSVSPTGTTKEENSSILLGWKVYSLNWLWFYLGYKKFTGEKYEFVKVYKSPEEEKESIIRLPADFSAPPGHIFVYGAEDFIPRLYRKIN
jgi:hypothetical protein